MNSSGWMFQSLHTSTEEVHGILLILLKEGWEMGANPNRE